MISPRFLLTGFLVAVVLCSARAQAPLPPLQLALTLNDGTAGEVYQGWPLLLRGDAVLMDEVTTPIPLDPAALRLTISPVAGGAPVSWPLRRTTEFSSPLALGPANEAVRVTWVMTAEQTRVLAPGSYSAKFSWAGRTSLPLALTVAPAPATPSLDDEENRSLLQSEVSQLLGDTAGALTALTAIEARKPESISLLVQRARVHVQRGESREALAATQRALTVFYRENPNPSHPPSSILEVQSRARALLTKSFPPGPKIPGVPGGPPRTVSVPPAVAPRGSATTTAPSALTPSPSAVADRATGARTPASLAVITASQSPGARFGAPSAGVVVPSGELNDVKILADVAGQWAATAQAKSSYSNPNYGAAKATGEPNVGVAGDSIEAWCPGTQNTGTDWLEVRFAQPARAVEVRVRQNHSPGAIAKVEVFEPDGTGHLWWEGKDTFVAPAVREVAWFAVRVPPTGYAVAKVRITLNLAAVSGWKQIDAVQLVGAP
jgi:hypothetical protein